MPTPLPNPPRPHPALIILPPALGVFMVTLDTTAANVALNQIHTQFNADLAAQQWIVDGYQIVYASLLLSAGALGDRIGNRTAFLAGTALFILASILCALAPSPITLILARLGQGVGAALLVPASLSVVRHGFHEERARAKAVSLWAATGSTALVAGPLLGGYLVQHFTWRSIFWLNVPVGLLSILLSLKSLRKHTDSPTTKLPLNLRAQSFGILALAATAFILIEGPHAGWSSPTVLTALALAAPALTLFLLTEFRHQNPIVPRHLWSRPEFVTVVSVGFISNYLYCNRFL